MDAKDFFAAVMAGIEERDHRMIEVTAGRTPPEILAQMEADGYVFAYSPAAEGGKRKIYFTRERDPVVRM